MSDGGELATAAPETEAPAGTDEAPPARRILVVEDNRDAAEVLTELLTGLGHEATLAHDADAGLKAARERRPDVVLCDINLPGEMDGYELARALREEADLERVRLVALTGFGRDVDRERAL